MFLRHCKNLTMFSSKPFLNQNSAYSNKTDQVESLVNAEQTKNRILFKKRLLAKEDIQPDPKTQTSKSNSLFKEPEKKNDHFDYYSGSNCNYD